MKKLILFIAASACCISVWSQNHSEYDCPSIDSVDSEHLYGTWQAKFADTHLNTVLQLGPHTQWQGMVQGAARRGSQRLLVVGDIDQGQLALEESLDGQRINASWQGQVEVRDCQLHIQGQWQQDENTPIAFTLQRVLQELPSPTFPQSSGW